MAKFSYRPLQKGKPRHFIKEWREYKGLNKTRLADRLDVTVGAISQIENGEVNYTQPMLEAIADALGVDPASLIMRNPLQEEAIWSLWDQAKQGQRSQIVAVVKAMLESDKTGTDG